MKANILKGFKNHWITVWLVVALMALGTIIAYGAYTRISIVKRVVSTSPGAGLLFSSNYMRDPYALTEEVADPKDYGGENQPAHPVYVVNVCNYAQGDKSVFYSDHTFTFTLKAQLVKNVQSGANGITSESLTASDIAALAADSNVEGSVDKFFMIENISLIDGAEHTIGTTYELNKGSASSQNFSVTLDRSELQKNKPEYYVKLTASPNKYTNDLTEQIVGYIGVSQRTVTKVYWEGGISDQLTYNTGATYTDEHGNEQPVTAYYDYDAYNYVINGYGVATINFLYDPSKLKISKIFLADIDFTEENANETDFSKAKMTAQENWKKISMTVTDADSRFELQLYKTSDTSYGATVKNAVGFYFTES